jgi:hypothetical protein
MKPGIVNVECSAADDAGEFDLKFPGSIFHSWRGIKARDVHLVMSSYGQVISYESHLCCRNTEESFIY